MRIALSADGLLNLSIKEVYRRELNSFVENRETQSYPTLILGIEYEFGRRFKSRNLARELEIDDQLERIR